MSFVLEALPLQPPMRAPQQLLQPPLLLLPRLPLPAANGAYGSSGGVQDPPSGAETIPTFAAGQGSNGAIATASALNSNATAKAISGNGGNGGYPLGNLDPGDPGNAGATATATATGYGTVSAVAIGGKGGDGGQAVWDSAPGSPTNGINGGQGGAPSATAIEQRHVYVAICLRHYHGNWRKWGAARLGGVYHPILISLRTCSLSEEELELMASPSTTWPPPVQI